MRKELREILGAEHLTIPDRGAWIARPGNVEETSEVVALAGRRGWSVAPRGGGTRADPAARPSPPDLVIETTRLDRVVFHSPEDLVLDVECGVRLRELSRHLAAADQWLPLDERAPEGATLGGTLATNSSGPLRLRAGTARDRVLGVSLVRFDGKVVRAGGAVVKNVAGYDLGKLYIGSWGAFGVLVSARLKLAPRPERLREILWRPASRHHAFERVRELEERHFPLLTAQYDEGDLLVGFSLSPELLDLPDAPLRAGPRPPPTAPPGLVLELSYPPGRYLEVMDRLEGTIPGAREVSLLLSGVTRLTWAQAPGSREGARLAERVDDLLAGMGGHTRIARMPMGWCGTVPRWRANPGAARLMSRLKSALDPDGVFPPLPGGERPGEEP